MKKIAFVLALALSGLAANAQVKVEPMESVADVFTVVDQMPKYPGGEVAMLNFLKTNIKYPQAAMDCGCQGTVFVTFVVDETGSVVDPKVLRGANCANAVEPKEGEVDCATTARQLSDEALRVIKLMPKWQPGQQNGKPVKVQMNLPVKFVMQ